MQFSLKKGFTLIELLVVIAIIGILATIVIGSLNSARAKARDAKRQADIKTIQNALEMYYLDHGEYPITTNIGGEFPNIRYANSAHASWGNLESVLGVSLPRDPINDIPTSTQEWAAGTEKKFNYAYYSSVLTHPPYCQPGQAYVLIYRLEKGDAPYEETPGVTRCDNGTQYRLGNGSITVGRSPMQ